MKENTGDMIRYESKYVWHHSEYMWYDTNMWYDMKENTGDMIWK